MGWEGILRRLLEFSLVFDCDVPILKHILSVFEKKGSVNCVSAFIVSEKTKTPKKKNWVYKLIILLYVVIAHHFHFLQCYI